MKSLDQIARANLNHNKVRDWHVKLTSVIPDAAVYYIFLNAVMEDNAIFFRDKEELTRAEIFSQDVRRVFPTVKMVSY